MHMTANENAARYSLKPNARRERIDRLKLEISSGTYVTPARLAATAEKLLDELFPARPAMRLTASFDEFGDMGAAGAWPGFDNAPL